MSYETEGMGIADSYPTIWALWAATRPSQVAGIELAYLLGLAMAVAGGPLTVGHRAVTLAAAPEALAGAIGLALVAVAVHYANEVADAGTDTLTDRTAFSGGSGAIATAACSRADLRRAWHASLVVAVFGAVAGVSAGFLPFDAGLLLVLGLGVGVAYSARPAQLIRRGLGEATNAVLVGALVPLYGIAVVGRPTLTAVVALVPVTLLFGCAYLAIHWPDRHADAAVGKRTLAVQLSPLALRRCHAGLATLVVAAALWLWYAGVVPSAVGVAHLAVVPAIAWAVHSMTRRRSPAPSVLAAVGLLVTSTAAWLWVGVLG